LSNLVLKVATSTLATWKLEGVSDFALVMLLRFANVFSTCGLGHTFWPKKIQSRRLAWHTSFLWRTSALHLLVRLRRHAVSFYKQAGHPVMLSQFVPQRRKLDLLWRRTWRQSLRPSLRQFVWRAASAHGIIAERSRRAGNRIGDELEGDTKYNCIAAGANGKLYAAPYDAGKVLEIDPEMSNVKEIGDALDVGEHTNVLLQAPKKNALQHNQAQQKSWRATPQSFLF
jgi:hypothetical protein